MYPSNVENSCSPPLDRILWMGKGQGQDVPVYVMKAYRQSRARDPRRHYMQVSGQPHALAALLPGKEPWVLSNKRLGGLQKRSGLLPVSGTEPVFNQPVTWSEDTSTTVSAYYTATDFSKAGELLVIVHTSTSQQSLTL